MTRVLITGATGLLGSSLVPFLREQGHEVITHACRSPADLNADLTSSDVHAQLDRWRPETIINLAALTNVDLCEQDPNAAYLLNVKAVDHLAAWTRARPGRHLIQVSTDQLYDGKGPSREDEVVMRNYYAFSKLAGELAAQSASSSVLRTNFFGRSACVGRASFSDWLHASLKSAARIQVFEDVYFSPLSIGTLCTWIELVLRKRPCGVFNLGSRSGMSKAEFAFEFARILNLCPSSMVRSRSTSSSLRARRPTDMRMDSSRLERELGMQLPDLASEIDLLRSQYREQS